MKDINGQPFALPEPKDLDRPQAPHAPAALPPYAGYGAYGDAEGSEENHFREYLRAVRKHLWMIFGLDAARHSGRGRLHRAEARHLHGQRRACRLTSKPTP